jgi:hypothetical protein
VCRKLWKPTRRLQGPDGAQRTLVRDNAKPTDSSPSADREPSERRSIGRYWALEAESPLSGL